MRRPHRGHRQAVRHHPGLLTAAAYIENVTAAVRVPGAPPHLLCSLLTANELCRRAPQLRRTGLLRVRPPPRPQPPLAPRSAWHLAPWLQAFLRGAAAWAPSLPPSRQSPLRTWVVAWLPSVVAVVVAAPEPNQRGDNAGRVDSEKVASFSLWCQSATNEMQGRSDSGLHRLCSAPQVVGTRV